MVAEREAVVSPVAGEAAPWFLSCDGERGTTVVRVAAVAFRAHSVSARRTP